MAAMVGENGSRGGDDLRYLVVVVQRISRRPWEIDNNRMKLEIQRDLYSLLNYLYGLHWIMEKIRNVLFSSLLT